MSIANDYRAYAPACDDVFSVDLNFNATLNGVEGGVEIIFYRSCLFFVSMLEINILFHYKKQL